MFNLLLNSENIFVKFSPFAKIARPKEKTAGCETLFTLRMNYKGQNSNIKFTQINKLRTAYIAYTAYRVETPYLRGKFNS